MLLSWYNHEKYVVSLSTLSILARFVVVVNTFYKKFSKNVAFEKHL